MPLADLFKISNLNEADFYMSIGWLALENKVAFFEGKKKKVVFLIY